MSVDTSNNLHNMTGQFTRGMEKQGMGIRSGTTLARMDIQRLNEQRFATNTLHLTSTEFDINQINDSDLEALKNAVMGELAKTRAEKQGWTRKPEGILAWLKDKFMTFFMGATPCFQSETTFHEHTEATKKG
ncbi:MAG: hypothetical protein LBB26_04605 [Puniceicoccales bacterium]|nr:hypothetical protein [Puniceicoccales bacterium]